MNPNEQRIREFAYQIWQSEGKPHGQAKRHWEMACKLAASDVQESAAIGSPKTKSSSKKQIPVEETLAVAKPAKKTKTAEIAPAAAKVDAGKKAKAKTTEEKAKTPEKVEPKKPASLKKSKTVESQTT